MRMNNKKGLNTLETLGAAVLVFATLAVLIYGIIPALKGGISGAQLQQCMKTTDLDGDGRIIDDSCACDPGVLKEQGAIYLKDHPDCVLTPLYGSSDANLPLQYVYGDVKDVEKCNSYAQAIAKDIYVNDKNQMCGTTTKEIETKLALAIRGQSLNDAPGKGIDSACALAISQKKPKSNEPINVCPTSASACEKRFRESPLCKSE